MSSTRRTPHLSSAKIYNLQEADAAAAADAEDTAAADAAAAAPGAAADTAAAAAEAAAPEAAAAEAAAWAAAAAGAAAAAVAACRGAVAASARLERLPIALTGADRHGRVDQFNPADGGLFAALPTWMRPKPAHSAERAASHIEKR